MFGQGFDFPHLHESFSHFHSIYNKILWKMEKQKRSMDTVICNNCGKLFEKAIVEINRTEIKGRKHYCSLTCLGKANTKNLGVNRGNVANFKGKTHRDQYTGFREFLRRAKKRKNLGNLTLDDLFKQWKKQNGICPYTGIELKLPIARKKHLRFETASLDRIDSNKPYDKENVVFVSLPINYMKNTMTEEETVAYCKKIALFWINKL